MSAAQRPVPTAAQARRHAEAIRRATAELEAAKVARDEAIRAAHAAGLPVTPASNPHTLMGASGLARSWVHKIVAGTNVEAPKAKKSAAKKAPKRLSVAERVAELQALPEADFAPLIRAVSRNWSGPRSADDRRIIAENNRRRGIDWERHLAEEDAKAEKSVRRAPTAKKSAVKKAPAKRAAKRYSDPTEDFR